MNGRNPSRRCLISLAAMCAVALCASPLSIAAQDLVADPAAPAVAPVLTSAPLPDAPSVVFVHLTSPEEARRGIALLPSCPAAKAPAPSPPPPAPCVQQHPLNIVVDSEQRQPLNVGHKGLLAARTFFQPTSMAFIGFQAAIGVAANAHSPYGPGFKGFGRLTGYSLAQDGQCVVLGTFLIPSLVHEDPRYRRMQNAGVKRRIFHALSRTVIAEHDDGRPMLNYATLLTYPISAELANLYVPGVHGNGPSTARRIAISYATDPASNLISEFLPDLARRIHVRSAFVQQIVNSMALNPGVTQ